MKERPIIFNTEMVKAYLAGRKTMTRRTAGLNEINKNPDKWVKREAGQVVDDWLFWHRNNQAKRVYLKCPYGQAGSSLWVRETWKYKGSQHETDGKVWVGEEPPISTTVRYAADGEYKTFPIDVPFKPSYAREGNSPSIFMPRWASRILLEITEVRVERLNQITEDDAKAEGICVIDHTSGGMYSAPNYPDIHRDIFMGLWDSIYKKSGHGWETNPWVFVIEFKKEVAR